MKTRLLIALLLPLLMLAAADLRAADLVIVNIDGPNEGFNDPTPAQPVGGNPGLTVGQQRLIAFQFAADIWGATLESAVPIRIRASFDPLPCTATTGTLGAAGAITLVSDFPGAQSADVWYPVALANKLAGADLVPASVVGSGDDIRAFFNSSLGQPGCLETSGWYYGLDGKEGSKIDLVAVLLHEFAHGLGFASYVDESNGTLIQNQIDVFSLHLFDTTTGQTWEQMNVPQRKASAINTRKVVWNGGAVTAAVPQVLDLGVPALVVNAPESIADAYEVGTAEFGRSLSRRGVTGDVVLALDGSGTTTDACQPIVSDVHRMIALVDRGTCAFVTKALNVQAAGAIGMIVANNVGGSPPPGMAGVEKSIRIPSVLITQADGLAIESQLGAGVNATIGLDTTRHAGADAQGRALVYTPDPVDPGSSISHWDFIALPNQLMEPFISSDLTHSVDVPADLTLPLLVDIGWD